MVNDACFSVIANTDGVKVNTESWKNLKLIEIGSVQDGDWILKEDYSDSGVRLIQIGDIGIGKFLGKSCRYITTERAKELGCNLIDPKSDILISRMPDPIGRACLAPNLSTPYIVAVDIAIFKPNFSVSRDYLIQILNFRRTLEVVDNLASGGTRRRISRKNLENISIPIPSPCVQRKIAAILSSVDAVIEQTESIITKLNDMKVGLVHHLLSCGINERGKLRDPRARPELFKNVPLLGQIPGDWNAPLIGSIAVHVGSGITPKGGSKVYKEQGIPFIRSQNVTFNGLLLKDIAHIDIETHEKMKRSEVFAHDVLLNITGASIGRCCPLPEGIAPANVNQHVCAIRLPNANREDAILLSSILASPIGQSQIDRFNAGGNREGLNYEQLRSFIIPWPPQKDRQRIARIIAAQNSRLSEEEAYLNGLKQLKKGLMQDLLTDRVPVKVDGHA
jgi:type I restriction enzyme S subunit